MDGTKRGSEFSLNDKEKDEHAEYLEKLLKGANSTRNYGYNPCRKNDPG